MQDYLAHDQESRLAQRLAGQSYLCRDHLGSYQPDRHSDAGTSMLLSGNPSLAALTSAASLSTRSISSSIGIRAIGKQRILELAGTGDDLLVIPPISQRLQLECPFSFLDCLRSFGNFEDWWEHSLTHFGQWGPPSSSRCCFCDMQFSAATGRECWKKRMEHVTVHHKLGDRLAHARPDFGMFKYLWDKKLISSAEYKDLQGNGHRGDDHDRSQSSLPAAVTSTNTNREHRRGHNRQLRRS